MDGSSFWLEVEASRDAETLFERSAGASCCGGVGRRAVVPSSCGAVWGSRQHGDYVGPALAGNRRCRARANARPPAARDPGCACNLAFKQAPGGRFHPAWPGGRIGRPRAGGDYWAVWRFVHEQGLTHKKDTGRQRAKPPRCCPPTRAVVEISVAHRPGPPRLHRRNLDQDQYGAAAGLEPVRCTPEGPRPLWPLEYHDLPGRAAQRPDRGALDDDGAINAERFRVYVEQVLAPTLTPGDIVVMDNLGSHKGKPVRRAIRQTGAKLIVGTICPPDRLLIPSNSCPNTCPTSTRSSSSSPSSNTACAPPNSAPEKPSPRPSPTASLPSHPKNVQTTSGMTAMDEPNLITL